MTGLGTIELVGCDRSGHPLRPLGELPEALVANCRGSADLYRRIGFEEPWVSYITLADGQPVGGGAFVGAPKDNRVEIAYFTLAEHEGRGYATGTARSLVDLARRTDPDMAVIAFTLPERNASTTILEKLGFEQTGVAQDDDAGEVWEWRLSWSST